MRSLQNAPNYTNFWCFTKSHHWKAHLINFTNSPSSVLSYSPFSFPGSAETLETDLVCKNVWLQRMEMHCNKSTPAPTANVWPALKPQSTILSWGTLEDSLRMMERSRHPAKGPLGLIPIIKHLDQYSVQDLICELVPWTGKIKCFPEILSDGTPCCDSTEPWSLHVFCSMSFFCTYGSWTLPFQRYSRGSGLSVAWRHWFPKTQIPI